MHLILNTVWSDRNKKSPSCEYNMYLTCFLFLCSASLLQLKILQMAPNFSPWLRMFVSYFFLSQVFKLQNHILVCGQLDQHWHPNYFWCHKQCQHLWNSILWPMNVERVPAHMSFSTVTLKFDLEQQEDIFSHWSCVKWSMTCS